MILFLQTHDNERQHWVINDISDLAPIFAQYPSTHDIAMNSQTLREACEGIAEYLSSGLRSAWVEDGLSKSLRNKAAALAIGIGAMTGSVQNLPKPTPSAKPSIHATPVAAAQEEKPVYDFGKNPHDRFLWNIKQIESSGGKNTAHRPIGSGKFKGMRAIGKWGLLKPTVDEILNRMKMEGSLTDEYSKLGSMSRDQLESHFKENPQIELNIARRLAQHVIGRQQGNKSRAAYAWLHGHNLHPADIPSEKLIGSDYVNKYRSVDTLNPFAPKVATQIKKTMQEVGNEDFKMRVKNWFKRRGDELTEEPTRSSNFQPDPGRLRDPELDQIKPDSMRTPLERLTQRTKEANKDSK